MARNDSVFVAFQPPLRDASVVPIRWGLPQDDSLSQSCMSEIGRGRERVKYALRFLMGV